MKTFRRTPRELPLVEIPGGEIWWTIHTTRFHRIASNAALAARARRPVPRLRLSRLSLTIALARWTASGLGGAIAAALRHAIRRRPL